MRPPSVRPTNKKHSDRHVGPSLDFQDVGTERHVVEAGADLRETHEDEEASDGIGDRVCGSLLEVRRVVCAWIRSDRGVTHAECARRACQDWGHGKEAL